MPKDRYSNDLRKGQTVEFVYGGDHHRAQIVDFDTDPVTKLERAVVEARFPVPVSTISTVDRKDDDPATPPGVPATPGGYDETQPDSKYTTSPEPAVQQHRDEIARREREEKKDDKKDDEKPKAQGSQLKAHSSDKKGSDK